MLNRRKFLQGFGGAALAAPLLPSIASREVRAQANTEFPQRIVMYFTHNGCLLANYRSSERSGALNFSGLSTFSDLVGLESKMSQLRGCAMFPRGTSVTYNGETIYFDPHDQGTASKLTAAPNDNANKWALGVSFDHVVAEMINPGADKTPLVFSPTGAGFSDVKSVLSYKVAGDGTAFSPEGNPGKIYSSLTGLFTSGSVTEPTTEADATVMRGASILDVTRDELVALQGRNMSAADKSRLEAWMELLRSTEQVVVPGGCNTEVAEALNVSEQTITDAGGTVSSGDSAGGGGGNFGGGGGFGGGGFGNTELQMTVGMEMHQKLAALTMVCDANRMILQHNQSFITFNFDGMDAPADHHGISHRTGSAAVGGDTYDPEYYEPFIKMIDDWYGKKYAQFVKILDSIPEGDGTLLDNTATVWLPELGDGEAHNNDDLPITIAGGMGGFLRTGEIIDVEPPSSGGGGGGGFGGGGGGFGSGGTPLNKFYVTLAQGAGAAMDTFGMCDSNDADAGITDPGVLAELMA